VQTLAPVFSRQLPAARALGRLQMLGRLFSGAPQDASTPDASKATASKGVAQMVDDKMGGPHAYEYDLLVRAARVAARSVACAGARR
jgi:hypothetical protein